MKESGVPLIADGGIRFSGDFAKAVAARLAELLGGGIRTAKDCVGPEVEASYNFV